MGCGAATVSPYGPQRLNDRPQGHPAVTKGLQRRTLRRLALNLLRTNRARTKMTMKAQRQKIGWDMSFLNDLLCHLD